MATLKLTQIRSTIRRTRSQRACLRGLGMRGIGDVAQVPDTPENMGMIAKVGFMLRVEGDIPPKPKTPSEPASKSKPPRAASGSKSSSGAKPKPKSRPKSEPKPESKAADK